MRMKHYVTVIAMLCVAACAPQEPEAPAPEKVKSVFRSSSDKRPDAPVWSRQQMGNAAGGAACAVTSGSNGIAVVVRKNAGGNSVSVQSNRFFRAGTRITVTVNGHRYETGEPYFSARDAVAMAEDFAAGDEVYVEWAELTHDGRLRRGTSYKLDGFKKQFDACLN